VFRINYNGSEDDLWLEEGDAPGAKAPSLLSIKRPKAEALRYLEAKAASVWCMGVVAESRTELMALSATRHE
jgi:hypothetical protein